MAPKSNKIQLQINLPFLCLIDKKLPKFLRFFQINFFVKIYLSIISKQYTIIYLTMMEEIYAFASTEMILKAIFSIFT
jgi:hypothetical protein